MFEITYHKNIVFPQKNDFYDFTFENRYHIFHRFRKGKPEYIALDVTTGLTSLIAEKTSPIAQEHYQLLIPEIIKSVKYNGDQRHKGAAAYTPFDMINIIFRVIMPQYGYTLREPQLELAKSIYTGLSSKKVTLCEAEVGTGKTMAYLVASITAKLFDKSYSFMGYPVTITTSSIELQKSILEKELPALSKMLMDFGLIDRPLTAVLRKGQDHYFCLRRYREYLHSISEDTPTPDIRDPAYFPAVAKEVVKLVKATHGHTAVLFTSYKSLNAVYDLVKDELSKYPLIKMSRSNKSAITQFKNSGNGVLFASGSMWEGVDCPGDILSSVIIVRLPFPLRTQIMEQKKASCASTTEFVQKHAVPQMIIKLRQGAGRLIRNETDTGVLAILDARAARGGGYRTRVRNALQKYPLVFSIKEVASFIDTVKDKSYKKEVPCG